MSIEKLSTSASLKQLIDKFEEISLQDFSSIDIITASELPSEGKENRICIITDIEPKNIFINYTDATTSTDETVITMKLSKDIKPVQHNIIGSNKMITLSYTTIFQSIGGKLIPLKSYIYKDGTWELLTNGIQYAFSDGNFLNTDLFGSFSRYSSSSSASGESKFNITSSNELQLITTKSSDTSKFRFSKKIDFTDFTKLIVDVSEFVVNLNGNYCQLTIGIYNGTTAVASYSTRGGATNQEITLDLSNITGSYYIEFIASTNTGTQYTGTYMKIRSIHLE